MIHARRTAHRRIFSVLAVAVPALWAAGLWLRPEVPPRSAADPRLLAEAGFALDAEGSGSPPRRVAAGAAAFEVEFERRPDGQRLLAIRPSAVILKPDLLVYWTPRAERVAPGGDAVLIGRLAGSSRRWLRLPERAADASGDVLVYSLAHGEVVSRFALAEALAGGAD